MLTRHAKLVDTSSYNGRSSRVTTNSTSRHLLWTLNCLFLSSTTVHSHWRKRRWRNSA